MTYENPLTPPTGTDPATTTPVPTASTPHGQPVSPAPLAPPAPVAVAVAAKRRSGGWMNVLLGVAVLVAVGGVAFAIGRTTAPASASALVGLQDLGGVGVVPGGSFDPGAFPGGNGGAGGPNLIGGFGNPSIEGTVSAIDGDSMTVTLASGEEMTIVLDDETTFHASSDASASDVAVGDDVSVGVDGFARGPGGGAGQDDGETPLTADDVTVSR